MQPKGAKAKAIGGASGGGMMGIGQMAAIAAAKRKKRQKDGGGNLNDLGNKRASAGPTQIDFTAGLKKRDSSKFEPKKFESKESAPAWSRNTLKRSSRPPADNTAKKDDSRAMPDWSAGLKKTTPVKAREAAPAAVNASVNFRAGLKASSPSQPKDKPAENNKTPVWARRS